MSSAVAVVLAAGKSTRMKSGLPKVLHPLCGRPMIAYLLDGLSAAGVERVLVVVGYRNDAVRKALADYDNLEFVEQTKPLGTGHAVWMCRDLLQGESRPVVVLCGDAPLLRSESIRRLLDRKRDTGATCLIASAVLPDPTGYGRIVRTADGAFDRIVEQRDATAKEQAIREVNSGLYAFECTALLEALERLEPTNAQGELYVTDCAEVLRRGGGNVRAEPLLDAEETLGVNNRMQLAEADRHMQRRIQVRVMQGGVTLVDPEKTYLDARASIGAETVIYPFTVLSGRVTVGGHCRIGPFAFLGDGATVEDAGVVGPFEKRGNE